MIFEALRELMSFEALTENLKDNQFLQTAVIGGITSVLLLYGKSIFNYTYRFIYRWIVYSAHVEDTNDLFVVIGDYMNKFYAHQYRNSMLTYNKKVNEYGDEILGESKLERKHYSDYYWVWWKGFPIFVTCSRTQIQGARESKDSHKYAFQFTTIKGKKHVESFVNKIIEYEESKSKDEFKSYIYTPMYRHWDRQTIIKPRKLDTIVSKVKDEVIEDIDEFLKSKSFYDKRGISFKRTHLYQGKPGNGKTSLAKSLAYHYNRHVYNLSIKDITADNEIVSLMSEISKGSILLIEEIDTYFEGRESKNKSMGGGISFSALLNVLDGVLDLDDLIIIITTNRPEKLANALIRPGRIDRIFTFDNPDEEEINKYLYNWFEEEITVKKYNKKMSFADLEGLCRRNDADSITKAIAGYKPVRNKEV